MHNTADIIEELKNQTKNFVERMTHPESRHTLGSYELPVSSSRLPIDKVEARLRTWGIKEPRIADLGHTILITADISKCDLDRLEQQGLI